MIRLPLLGCGDGKKRLYILTLLLSHKICAPEKLLHWLNLNKKQNIKINQFKILKTKSPKTHY